MVVPELPQHIKITTISLYDVYSRDGVVVNIIPARTKPLEHQLLYYNTEHQDRIRNKMEEFLRAVLPTPQDAHDTIPVSNHTYWEHI